MARQQAERWEADKAGHRAQRQALSDLVKEWRDRALAAEAEVKALEKQINQKDNRNPSARGEKK